MTSKETIKEFEHLLKVEKDRIHKDVVFITALENAIEALEKQIPKKPIEKSPWVYHCPNCDSQNIEEVFIERFKFCRDCGQALDWGDSNE